MGDFIPDLKHLVKTARFQEAKEALNSLSRRPDAEQEAAIEVLALASDKAALELLSFLMETTPPDHPLRQRIFQLTTDRAHINYAFAGILLVHSTPDQIRQLTPLLKHILSKETKGELLNRILRVVGKLKLESLIDDVAEFIFYDDAALKQESVKALERMATPMALQRLKQVAATDKCDLDVLDAIDMLEERLQPDEAPVPAGEPSPQKEIPPEPEPAGVSTETTEDQPDPEEKQDAMTTHLKLLGADNLQDRHEAFLYFSDQGDRVADALRASIDSPDTDLMVNLLRLAARTIPQKAVGDLLTIAGRKDLEKSLKFSVYTALSHLPELESAASIVTAVTDPVMYVRMAAINALDRHCSDFVIAEIKKRIESGTKVGETLGISILDAGATRLIDALMDSDTFSYITSNYLERGAPLHVIDAYISVLEKRKRVSTVKKYSRIRLEQAETDQPFFVVIHPNTPFLNVYAKLIHGCGFNVRTFTGPQEAFESIVFEKPAAIICDLFVRQLTAIDLAREIRELYPKEEVPIIVSSLQKDLDKTTLETQFEAAGINGFYDFPAKPNQIKTWATAQ
ncbi:MAG: hypothetical protein MI863_25865 [Desulfobacterales bacterium]|nr:hypothetical protein [Desulfobacterales bacterium]